MIQKTDDISLHCHSQTHSTEDLHLKQQQIINNLNKIILLLEKLNKKCFFKLIQKDY
jgi:hypothetical protein